MELLKKNFPCWLINDSLAGKYLEYKLYVTDKISGTSSKKYQTEPNSLEWVEP